MKLISNIIGALLGLAFIAFGVMFFFNLMPKQPAPPAGSPVAMFFGAFGATGYMALVKACEILGGLLTAIPRTRNFGLLILGPILINILAFQIFIAKGQGLFDPPLIVLCTLAAYLLWDGRRKFAHLLR